MFGDYHGTLLLRMRHYQSINNYIIYLKGKIRVSAIFFELFCADGGICFKDHTPKPVMLTIRTK